VKGKQRLLTVVVLGLAGVVAVNQWSGVSNVASPLDPTSPLASSSVLYCPGLTNAAGGLSGSVVLFNTTASSRHVVLSVTSPGSTSAVVKRAFTLPAYGQHALAPSRLAKAAFYAVTAAIDGGGVRGEVLSSSGQSEASCASRGVTHWVATGLSTLVGSSATLALFNPTATSAVFNVQTYSANGFLQPAAWQGLTVAPKGLVTIDLSTLLANTSAIGVDVRVVRGSLVSVADQVINGAGSFSAGSRGPSARDRFALVPTANRVLARIVVSNPARIPAHVSLGIGLGKFAVPSQRFTVAPLTSSTFVVTPNTAIPAAGLANVTLRASVPVIAALQTGIASAVVRKSPLHLSPQRTSWRTWLIADATGRGYGNVLVSNTSHHTLTITVVGGALGHTPTTVITTIEGDTSRNLLRLAPQLATLRHAMVTITAGSNDLLVTATASAQVGQSGTVPRTALDGR
jgi:hypothetical protein